MGKIIVGRQQKKEVDLGVFTVRQDKVQEGRASDEAVKGEADVLEKSDEAVEEVKGEPSSDRNDRPSGKSR